MLTLPPGWTGNNALHHADVGRLRLTVRRRIDRHTRGGRHVYAWSLSLVKSWMVNEAPTELCPTNAADARKAAILAARVIAMEIAQGCDWLDRASAPLTVAEGTPS